MRDIKSFVYDHDRQHYSFSHLESLYNRVQRFHSAKKNKIAHRGNSKEKRTDCPLVVLALVVDSQGMPIFSQIHKGNQSEPETLESILERLYCAEQVEIVLLHIDSHVSKNTAQEHIDSFYEKKSFSEIKGQKFDDMIITGALVEHLGLGTVTVPRKSPSARIEQYLLPWSLHRLLLLL